MLVIWRIPARPTPIQRLVSRITEVDRHEVNAVVELAYHARLEADIADEDGRHSIKVDGISAVTIREAL